MTQKQWTRFMDMHSGGDQKTPFRLIFINLSEKEAKVFFKNFFDRDPENVTCDCCGEDFSIGEYETLEQASAFYRNCAWSDEEKRWVEEQCTRYGNSRPYLDIKSFSLLDDVIIIPC